MGSFNTTCAVTGTTLHVGDPVVGFMLRRRDTSALPAGRPIRSLMDVWEPMHLPINGRAFDCGTMIALEDNSRPIETAENALRGFNYEERLWESLLETGDMPSDKGPIDCNDAHYMLWMIRHDVYELLIGACTFDSKTDLKISPAVQALIDATDKTPSTVGDLINGKLFEVLLKSLNAIGYVFRRRPVMNGGTSPSVQRKRKAEFFSKETPEPTPGRFPEQGPFYYCGVTGQPLAIGARAIVLPLNAIFQNNPNDTSPLLLDERQPTGLYKIRRGLVEVTIGDDGSIQCEDERLGGRYGTLGQMIDSDIDVTWMLISDQALSQLPCPEKASEKIRAHSSVMLEEIFDIKTVIASGDIDLISDWVHKIGGSDKDIADLKRFHKGDPDLKNYFRLLENIAHQRLTSLSSSNLVAHLLLGENDSIVDFTFRYAVLNNIYRFIFEENASSSEIQLNVLRDFMHRFEGLCELEVTFMHYGLAFIPTEPRSFENKPQEAALLIQQLRQMIAEQLNQEAAAEELSS